MIVDNLMYEIANKQTIHDFMHLHNFCNYLFRSDKDQKWTNEQTPLCMVLYNSEGKNKIETIGDLSKRKELKKYIYDTTIGAVGNSRLSTKLFNDMCEISLNPVYEKSLDVNITSQIFQESVLHILKENEIELGVCPEKIMEASFCFVFHVDQTVLHIHRLFRKIQKRKK